MALDIRTIVVLLVVASVAMTLLMIVGGYGVQGAGFRQWAVGLAWISLGWILIATRGVLPDVIAVVLADTLLFVGPTFHIAALLEYAGRRAPRWLTTVPGAAFFAVVYTAQGDYALLTLVTGAAFCLVMGAAAFVAFGLGAEKGGRMRLVIASLYVVGALPVGVRALVVWNETEHVGIYSTNPVHAVAFVALFAVTVGGSFAFLLMGRERSEAQMRDIAMKDALTGLFNRRAFMDLAERELTRVRRAGAPFAVLMLDIDHFKKVNDTHGHQAGDSVLAEFAARAQRCIRAGDVLGRYGGEEFCVLLPGAALQTAVTVAERIRALVEAHPLGQPPSAVTVSIGVAGCDDAKQAELGPIIGRADKALYDAKRAGRNRVLQQHAA